MSAKTDVEIHSDDLLQIVSSVFDTMLGLEAFESGAPWQPTARWWTAAVYLSGEWNGAVLVECDHEQAARFAARFLSIDLPEAVNEMIRDVLGELANMIGGNVKSVLMSGIRLSMPSTVHGSDYNIRLCGGTVRQRMAFECNDGAFWVTILTLQSPTRERMSLQALLPAER
ncbi:MAG TPA: chemotaxis protein CheX [Terracidiphilus sp.]|nr:chemotaxis protein CheX [Terracidiphilus sp.]